MPYPMTPLPSFAEFRQKLESEWNCEYKTLPEKLTDEKGNEHAVRYLERDLGGRVARYVVECDEDEILVPSLIRSICARLEIDPRELNIGFDLG